MSWAAIVILALLAFTAIAVSVRANRLAHDNRRKLVDRARAEVEARSAARHGSAAFETMQRGKLHDLSGRVMQLDERVRQLEIAAGIRPLDDPEDTNPHGSRT